MVELLNRRELVKELDKRFKDEEYSISTEHIKDRYDREFNTPIWLKQYGYICVGHADIWNDVGCIEYTFKMYKPRGNGTIKYGVEFNN